MRRILPSLVQLAVTVALLAFVVTRVNVSEMLRSIASADGFFLALAFAGNLVGRYLLALQTSIALRHFGAEYGALRLFDIAMRTLFYSVVLPGDAAGLGIKWFLISRIAQRRAAVLATLVYLRIVNLIVLVVLGLIATVIVWPTLSATLATVALATLGGLCALTAAIHLRITKRFLAAQTQSATRLPAPLKDAFDRIHRAFLTIGEFSVGRLLRIWVLSILAKFVVTVSFLLVGSAIGLDITLVAHLALHSMVELVQMLPVTVLGLGTREVSVVYMLGELGVTQESALAFSLTVFALRVVAVLAGGLLALARSVRPAGDSA